MQKIRRRPRHGFSGSFVVSIDPNTYLYLMYFTKLSFQLWHSASCQKQTEYRKVASSRPVYYSIFELFWPKVTVHKHQISLS